MGEGKEENAIVTSTGEYVVAWDFAKVKKGQLDKYEIKKCVCHPPSTSAAPRRSTPSPSYLLAPIGSLEANANVPTARPGTTSSSCKTASSLATTRRSYVSNGEPPPFLRPRAPDLRIAALQIVALQNDVLAINKKNLKRPTRASLAPGGGRSRSSMVNSPY